MGPPHLRASPTHWRCGASLWSHLLGPGLGALEEGHPVLSASWASEAPSVERSCSGDPRASMRRGPRRRNAVSAGPRGR
eukprot:4946384-Pyramimonas_sp.AAC.1